MNVQTRRAAKALALAVSATLLLALSACGASSLPGTSTGSGTLKTETRDVANFSAVSLSGIGNMTIKQTGTESLTIEAEDNVLPTITSDVSGNVLYIGVRAGPVVRPTKGITYTLTVKTLDAVTVLGAANIDAHDITTNALTVTLSGAGNMTISGQTQSQNVTISGAGAYQAGSFTSKTATVSVSGVGGAIVNVTGTLDARITGAGGITYKGNPTVTKSVSGLGTVRQG